MKQQETTFLGGLLRKAFLRATSDIFSIIGSLLFIASLFLFLIFVVVFSIGEEMINPYYGAFVFLGLPGLIVGSVFVFAFGVYRQKQKERRKKEESLLEQPRSAREEKQLLISLSAGVVIVVLLLLFSGLQVDEFMSSNRFCGDSCHSVMEPEAVAHSNSTHMSVQCVKCHVGEGIKGLVQSKWEGSHRLIGIALNNFERPVPTPVKNLPPPSMTCVKCHDTAREIPSAMRLVTNYQDDEKSTPKISAVVLHTGSSRSGSAHGIHAHASEDLQVRYFSAEGKRQKITYVESVRRGEEPQQWFLEGEEPPHFISQQQNRKGLPIRKVEGKGEFRTMDCIDCHNRVGHQFPEPAKIVNRLIEQGDIPADAPFAKAVARKALERASEVPKEKMLEVIQQTLNARWQYVDGSDEVAQLLAREAAKYLYPEMKIGWGNYKSEMHHERSEGCFRCHNQWMKNAKGEHIDQSCSLCHITVADNIPKVEWDKRLSSLENPSDDWEHNSLNNSQPLVEGTEGNTESE